MNRFKMENKINNTLNKIEKNIRMENNLDLCLQMLEDLLNQPYCRTRILNLKATIYYYNGELEKSLGMLKELYKKDPNYPSLFILNKILFNLGDIDTVQAYVDDIEDLSRKHLYQSFINKYLGEYHEAINHLHNLRFTTLEELSNRELGSLYRLLHDNEKAKYYYNKLLNTPYRNSVLIRLMEIALEEQDPNVIKLINQYDGTNHSSIGDRNRFYNIRCYYKYINGKIRKTDVNTYLSRQLYSYSKDIALEHIYKHHVINEKRNYKILSDIDIETLYEDVIGNLNSLIRRDASDIYRVELPYDIGEMLGYRTNLVNVVTISHTNNILTIYPVPNIEKVKEKRKEMKKC